jgi:hypothetical protein
MYPSSYGLTIWCNENIFLCIFVLAFLVISLSVFEWSGMPGQWAASHKRTRPSSHKVENVVGPK